MNSRDAAYDEEEQLRRAIEESKEDTKSLPDDTATRRGKRSRSDSEACVFSHFNAKSRYNKVTDRVFLATDKVPNVNEPHLPPLQLYPSRIIQLLNPRLMMNPKTRL